MTGVTTLNLNELNPFEGGNSFILTENKEGLWKGLPFNLSTTSLSPDIKYVVYDSSDNMLKLSATGGGGGGGVSNIGLSVQGAILGQSLNNSGGSSLKGKKDLLGETISITLDTTFNPEHLIDHDHQLYSFLNHEAVKWEYRLHAQSKSFSKIFSSASGHYIRVEKDFTTIPTYKLTLSSGNASLGLIEDDSVFLASGTALTLFKPLDLSGNIIQNVGTPTQPTDAVTKSYTDTEDNNIKAMTITATGEVTGALKLGESNPLTISDKSIELTGETTGTGSLGGTIATTIANKSIELTGETTGTGSLGGTIATTIANKSIELTGDLTGTGSLGGAIATTIANKSIALTGDLTGTGSLGGAIATTFTLPLDAKSNRLINVGAPTVDSDGATKKYVDDNSGGGGGGGNVTLDGSVEGTGAVGSTITTSFPATLAMPSYCWHNYFGIHYVLRNGDAFSQTPQYAVRKRLQVLNDSTFADISSVYIAGSPTNYAFFQLYASGGALASNSYYEITPQCRFKGGFISYGEMNAGGFKLTALGEPTVGNDAATRTYVDGLKSIDIGVNGSVTGNLRIGATNSLTLALPIDAQGQAIKNVLDPIAIRDAANKQYVDALKGLNITAHGAVTGNLKIGVSNALSFALPIDAQNDRIVRVNNPTDNMDAANKQYVDALKGLNITAYGAVTGNLKIGASNVLSFALPINAQNNKITNVATPTTGTDAANKAYVDSGGTVTLNGVVQGSGQLSSPITTSFSSPFDLPSNYFSHGESMKYVIRNGDAYTTTPPYGLRKWFKVGGNNNFEDARHVFSVGRETRYAFFALQTNGDGTLSTNSFYEIVPSCRFLGGYSSTGEMDGGGFNLSNIADPTELHQAVNKGFHDSSVSTLTTLIDQKHQDAKDYADQILQAANTNSITYTNGQVSSILSSDIGLENEGSAQLRIGETKAFVINYPLDTHGGKITGLPLPSAPTDVANKQYVDTASGSTLPTTITGDISGTIIPGTLSTLTILFPINAEGGRIYGLRSPASDTDAATKKYVDDNSGGDPSPITGDIVGTINPGSSSPLSLSNTIFHNFGTRTTTWNTGEFSDVTIINSRTNSTRSYKERYEWPGAAWEIETKPSAMMFSTDGGDVMLALMKDAGTVNVNNHRIVNVSAPAYNNDAVPKIYVDLQMAALQARLVHLEKMNGIKYKPKKKKSFFKTFLRRKS